MFAAHDATAEDDKVEVTTATAIDEAKDTTVELSMTHMVLENLLLGPQ